MSNTVCISPTTPASRTSKFRSWVAEHNGTPALFVNGRPVFLNAPYLFKAPFESFAEADTGVYMVHDLHMAVSDRGQADITAVSREIDDLLDKDPDAMVIVRSFPPAPLWWLDQHPDEELRFDRDITKYGVAAGHREPSWASDRWLSQVCEWYEQWCSALHDRFGGQVIGHQFGMGSHGENNPVGACANDGRWFCGDFSPAMTAYFRRWLRRRYPSDQALRDAWSDRSATRDQSAVPSRLQRLQTDWFTFRSPVRRHVADYYEAFAARVEHCVIEICRAIKRSTDGACIAGSHLGALMDNGFHGYLYHQTCINICRKSLEDPAVDTFTSPASYEGRCPGGDANTMMPAGSIALHGKLIFQDQDTRTSVLPAGYREAFTLGTLAADIPESISLLTRDFAHAVIRGYGLWWHAMVRGMYDHPEISRCIATLSEIGRRSMDFPRGVADGVAMIVDEESAFHQECANRLLYPMLYYQRQRYWSRAGVAWNTFLHNDLSHPRMKDHKLYYFLNTFYMTDEELEAVERKVKRSGATAIWTYAPGIQSPAGFSLERVERLTGFRLKVANVQALPRITLTDHAHPLVRYAPPTNGDQYIHGNRVPGFFGTGPMGNDERERVLGPIVYVDDPGAIVLGELDCLQVPGYCVKPMDGWTSIFCAAPMLNAHLLRNAARYAGVHVYSEGDDVVLPGRSFVMIHARTAGPKTIRLPRPADVVDCYSGTVVGRNLSEIHDQLARHQTKLYFVGDAGQW